MKKKILNTLNSVNRKGMRELIDWLQESDFFIAPCSKDHHLNVKGGLAQHSWNVFTLFEEKNKRYKLGLSKDSVIICSLLHDICKVYFYKLVYHNTQKAFGGTPQGYNTYEYDDRFPIGHGEKSVIILSRFIYLTDEECCIIRWHMAGFDLSSYSKPAYYKALEMYPACLALHTADYEATTFLEKK